MKQLLFLSVLIPVLLLSCKEEEDHTTIIENEPEIKIFVYYTTNNSPGIQQPDVNAKVFVYYGINGSDVTAYSYKGEGKFVKGDHLISPDQSLKADNNGEIMIDPFHLDKQIFLLIESNYYKEMRVSTSYPYYRDGITATFIFN